MQMFLFLCEKDKQKLVTVFPLVKQYPIKVLLFLKFVSSEIIEVSHSSDLFPLQISDVMDMLTEMFSLKRRNIGHAMNFGILICQLIGQLICQLIGQIIGQLLIGQLICQQIYLGEFIYHIPYQKQFHTYILNCRFTFYVRR